MVFEAALLAARVWFGGAAAAAAKPLPQFLHERETDTEARGNRGLRGVPGFQGLYNAVTEVLRVWFHTPHCTLMRPDMQLQTALVGHEWASEPRPQRDDSSEYMSFCRTRLVGVSQLLCIENFSDRTSPWR